MSVFEQIHQRHTTLLVLLDQPQQKRELLAQSRQFLADIERDSAQVTALDEREHLIAIVQFWSFYIHERTRRYPRVTLCPVIAAAPVEKAEEEGEKMAPATAAPAFLIPTLESVILAEEDGSSGGLIDEQLDEALNEPAPAPFEPSPWEFPPPEEGAESAPFPSDAQTGTAPETPPSQPAPVEAGGPVDESGLEAGSALGAAAAAEAPPSLEENQPHPPAPVHHPAPPVLQYQPGPVSNVVELVVETGPTPPFELAPTPSGEHRTPSDGSNEPPVRFTIPDDFVRAFVWLNQFNEVEIFQPNLKEALNELITSWRSQDDSFNALVAEIRDIMKSMGNEPAKGEALVQIAAMQYKRGYLNDLGLVEDQLDAAADIFEAHQDLHREGLIRWMSGYVQWRMGDRYEVVFRNWKRCLKIFQSLCERYHRQDELGNLVSDPERVTFYRGCIAFIGDALVRCLLELITVDLPRFVGSSLERDDVSRMLRDEMRQKLDARDEQGIRLSINHALHYVLNRRERQDIGEMEVQAAYAHYATNNYAEAERLLQAALSRFAPESHQVVVILLALGSIQWLRNKHARSLDTFDRCRITLEALRIESEHANLQERVRWYKMRFFEVTRAVDLLSLIYQSRPSG